MYEILKNKINNTHTQRKNTEHASTGVTQGTRREETHMCKYLKCPIPAFPIPAFPILFAPSSIFAGVRYMVYSWPEKFPPPSSCISLQGLPRP